MLESLKALLLGIIEGITEFLPISSTGHLIIAERWLGYRSDLFNIAIQAGAILAVVVIYRRRLWDLATRFFTDATARTYTLKLGVAFVVTAALGIAVKKMGFELPEEVRPIAWALLIGAIGVFLGITPERVAELGRRARDGKLKQHELEGDDRQRRGDGRQDRPDPVRHRDRRRRAGWRRSCAG